MTNPNLRLQSAICRRAFLGRTLQGAGALGMANLLGRVVLADDSPSWQLPTASAKRVIMVFFNGGSSQLDLFDDKPLLRERRGEEIPPSIIRGQRTTIPLAEDQGALPAVGSKFAFKRHGKCGMSLSELIPGIGAVADLVTVCHSLQTDFSLHEAAISTLFTGTMLQGRPSWGAWSSYALASGNENVPKFVALLSGAEGGTPHQPKLWHSAFLPGRTQGVRFRSGKDPVHFIQTPAGVTEASRKAVLDAVKGLNELEAESTGDPEVTTRTEAYEMAARMQTSVPELTDLSKEPKEVLDAYGVDPKKSSFAANCLLARRLAESGVRFIQIMDGGWDHHFDLPRALERKAKQVDKPIGALIADLHERELLDDTLVLCVGEFGRTPYGEGALSARSYGREHHALANSIILAGGGIKRGFTYGKTDDWGWNVVENPLHVHDLQATVLHCLGLDHEKLVFRHQARDFRLTDVGGKVAHGLLA